MDVDLDRLAKRHFFDRSSDYFMAYEGYKQGKSMSKIKTLLNEPRHRITETPQSNRVLTHWMDIGLIADTRKSGKGWRMFSSSQLIWLETLASLRDFGTPLESLKIAKLSLFDYQDDPNQSPEIDMHIVEVLNSQRVWGLTYADGWTNLLTHESLLNRIGGSIAPHVFRQPHICLDFNEIVGRVLEKAPQPKLGFHTELSINEMQAIMMLRNPGVSQLTIKLKDGQPDIIEQAEQVDPKTLTAEALRDVEFGRVETKKQDGKVQSIERIIQQKAFK